MKTLKPIRLPLRDGEQAVTEDWVVNHAGDTMAAILHDWNVKPASVLKDGYAEAAFATVSVTRAAARSWRDDRRAVANAVVASWEPPDNPVVAIGMSTCPVCETPYRFPHAKIDCEGWWGDVRYQRVDDVLRGVKRRCRACGTICVVAD